jgi:hypothetical protein
LPELTGQAGQQLQSTHDLRVGIGAEPGLQRTRPPELAHPGQGSPGLLVAIVTFRHSLEAHLSLAVCQQGVEAKLSLLCTLEVV